MTTSTAQLLGWADRRGPDARRLVGRALDIAHEAHRGEFRRSGDPFVEHPTAVALVLAGGDAGLETVIAAILHEIPVDSTDDAVARFRVEFGHTVATIVTDFLVLDRMERLTAGGTPDCRAVQVKIADRLHNMRTIRFLEPEKQIRGAAQTLEWLVPLAHSSGMAAFVPELTSLSTATLRLSRAAQSPPPRAARTQAFSASLGTLSVGALLLPQACRERWLRDWEGELHALPTLRERALFVIDVLCGLPTMAVVSRRTGIR